MDAKQIEKLVMKAKDDIIKEVHDKLPRKVGVLQIMVNNVMSTNNITSLHKFIGTL